MKLFSARWAAAALLLLSVGASVSAPAQPRAGVIVREQIVVRMRGRAQPQIVLWKEGKGPKCVEARSIAGAALVSQNSVDLVLRDRKRIRARLESSCPALDYYYGFYITPNKDGMICADRDFIRSRVGGRCEIDAFRSLQVSAER